jgi:phosphate/sulfate permease
MTSEIAEGTNRSRKIVQSAGALIAGFIVNVGMDVALRAAAILPALGVPMTDAQSLLATVYRTLIAIISSYVVARLAPHHPLEHALVGGAIGMALAAAGAAATWNRGLGPHWYPLALVVLALPTAWAGGKIRQLQKP